MRYPLSQADWPTAFNKFSKYLGRHWPTGNLPLNTARERASRLLGYNSVHDLKQELVTIDQVPEADHRYMHRHMWMKAWVLYRCPVASMSRLLERLPWKELSAHQAFEEAQSKRMPIFIDEFSYYGDSKTNPHMIRLLEEKVLPPYGYALNQNGEMYLAEHAESILEFSDSLSGLDEIGFEGTFEEFLQEHLMPMFWRPLDEVLAELTLDNPGGLSSGTHCYVHKIADNDDASVIRYLGYGFSAFLPVVVRTDEQLRKYLGMFLRREPFYELNDPFDTQDFYAATNKEARHGQWFEVDGQYLYADQGENRELWTALGEALPGLKTYWEMVDPEPPIFFLSSASIRMNRAVDLWRTDRTLDQKYLDMTTEDRQALLTKVFGNKFITGQMYLERGNLIPEDSPVTLAECIGGRNAVRGERSEFIDIGQSVVEYHPELKAFFDEEALGYLLRVYEDRGDRTWLLSTDMLFIGFLLYYHQCTELTPGLRVNFSHIHMMSDLALRCLICEPQWFGNDQSHQWRIWSRLVTDCQNSSFIFNKALRAKEELAVINQDARYISNGPKKHIVREGMVEMLSRLMKASRFKLGSE